MDEAAYARICAYSAQVASEKAVPQLRLFSQALLTRMQKTKLITGISGVRGAGKSSLLLEFVKNEKGLYISGDFLLKYGIGLYDALHYAYANGVRAFGIDEISMVGGWPSDLKLFYDSSSAKVAITGSSAIELAVRGSDLARRAEFHPLPPFSFREYLFFKSGANLPEKSPHEIVSAGAGLARSLAQYDVHYSEFVASHALPAAFFQGKGACRGIMERIIYHDLLPLKNIDAQYIGSAFKLLKFLASSEPGASSYNAMANSIGKSVKFTIELVRLLSLSGIITVVAPDGGGHKGVRGDDKILFPLPFRSVLGDYFGFQPLKGALREDFFIHHARTAKHFRESGRRTPDYLFEGSVFEIGGAGKGTSQILGMKNAYLVKEGFPSGKNELSLYAFGLLY
jgi:predicted AAA+ superfamily ATPase